ncbi:MAG TPA: hypothetical protein VE422_36660 [Terriglobia bacterium]|nr:hypothetical protein [Terriglobia bacterium]
MLFTRKMTDPARPDRRLGVRSLSFAVSSLRTFALPLLVLLAVLLFKPVTAHAGLCGVPAEDGTWHNYDSNTQSVTWVVFRMECRDASRTVCNGNICTTTSAVEPHYFIKVWGKCHPTDCYWGEAEGVAQTGSNAGWYTFHFDQGFANRYVWVRTYPQWPGWLRVWIWNDFVDPGRADYTIDEWFLH